SQACAHGRGASQSQPSLFWSWSGSPSPWPRSTPSSVSMRPDVRLFAAAAAVAVVAIAVPVLLVWRALPPRMEPEVVAAGGGASAPVALERAPGDTQRLSVAAPHFPALRGVQVQVKVGTYERR